MPFGLHLASSLAPAPSPLHPVDEEASKPVGNFCKFIGAKLTPCAGGKMANAPRDERGSLQRLQCI